MRILYLTLARCDQNNLPDCEKADYQSDLLFIGLRELYGDSVIDYPKKEFLYKNYTGNISNLWGRGFSNAKELDDISIYRGDDLGSKMINNFFDLIVLSVHHTIHNNPSLLYHHLESFKNHRIKSKIAVVDGHDLTNGYNKALEYTAYVFKREIAEENSPFIPIHFAIPASRIRKDLAVKTRLMAPILPADHTHKNRTTHIYENEQDYYQQYAESYFGLACRKGGFDGMRALEIFANGCICLYTDIENCYPNTLTNMPKDVLSRVKKLSFLNLPKQVFTKNEIEMGRKYVKEDEFGNLSKQDCIDLCGFFLDYAKSNLTTKTLGKYFIGKLQ